MPELPEVEIIRRQLEKVLVGQRIKKIKVLKKKSLQGDSLQVEGKRIVRVRRKAKVLIVELEGGKYLLIHLKMTGQLIYYDEKSQISNSKKQTKHTRVVFELDRGKLFFNDMRVFGWIKVVDDGGMKKEFSKFGPDVISKEFTVEHLRKVLMSSGRAVKLILVDQKKIGGIGNIYANDGLYCAGIDPRKKAREIGEDRKLVKKLQRCLKKVIEAGIKYGGATASDDKYINAQGLRGKYQEHFLVYEKAGEKCSKCKGKIRKIKLGGRGTYFCQICQK